MSVQEKRVFLESLIENVKNDLLATVDRLPEDWDGIELREYVADKFSASRHMSNPYHKPQYKRRIKDYKNTLMVTNL